MSMRPLEKRMRTFVGRSGALEHVERKRLFWKLYKTPLGIEDDDLHRDLAVTSGPRTPICQVAPLA